MSAHQLLAAGAGQLSNLAAQDGVPGRAVPVGGGLIVRGPPSGPPAAPSRAPWLLERPVLILVSIYNTPCSSSHFWTKSFDHV